MPLSAKKIYNEKRVYFKVYKDAHFQLKTKSMKWIQAESIFKSFFIETDDQTYFSIANDLVLSVNCLG